MSAVPSCAMRSYGPNYRPGYRMLSTIDCFHETAENISSKTIAPSNHSTYSLLYTLKFSTFTATYLETCTLRLIFTSKLDKRHFL